MIMGRILWVRLQVVWRTFDSGHSIEGFAKAKYRGLPGSRNRCRDANNVAEARETLHLIG
jgi:hypothetical protein